MKILLLYMLLFSIAGFLQYNREVKKFKIEAIKYNNIKENYKDTDYEEMVISLANMWALCINSQIIRLNPIIREGCSEINYFFEESSKQ